MPGRRIGNYRNVGPLYFGRCAAENGNCLVFERARALRPDRTDSRPIPFTSVLSPRAPLAANKTEIDFGRRVPGLRADPTRLGADLSGRAGGRRGIRTKIPSIRRRGVVAGRRLDRVGYAEPLSRACVTGRLSMWYCTYG